MKYLAVDYGQKRTGIAVSDKEGRMAFPRRTLVKRTRERFFAELFACLAEEAPDAIVVGLPLSMDGSESLSTRQARRFVERLKRRTDMPLFWMDETLSSHEAEQDLRAAGVSGARGRDIVDQQAACRILESFLAQPEPMRSRA
jgi:putative Holliday junction resolvase